MEELTKQEIAQKAAFMHELRENTLEGVKVSKDYEALLSRVWGRSVYVPAFIIGPEGFDGAFIKSVADKSIEIYTKSTLVCKYSYSPDTDEQSKKLFVATCEDMQVVFVTKGK